MSAEEREIEHFKGKTNEAVAERRKYKAYKTQEIADLTETIEQYEKNGSISEHANYLKWDYEQCREHMKIWTEESKPEPESEKVALCNDRYKNTVEKWEYHENQKYKLRIKWYEAFKEKAANIVPISAETVVEETEEEDKDEDEEFYRNCECGFHFADGQRFCRRCGKERQHTEHCPKCGVVVGLAEKTCQKCGTEIHREDKELDLCGECGNPFKDAKERFCRKCQVPRPLSENQCECGAFYESADHSVCSHCGLKRFDAKVEEQKIAEKEKMQQEFEFKKQQKRERSRQSLLLLDNQRQEEADRKQKEEAIEKKAQIEKAARLPPGALMRAITECDETVALSVVNHPSFNEAHTRDGRGCTTLHCAAERGLTNVCRAMLMLPNFRDAAVKDNEGWTALHRAAKNGHALACKCLASHPALNNKDGAVGRDGFTALHCSALHGFTSAVKVLLDHPKFTEVNAVDNWGRTALHCAAEYGHPDTVKALLDHPRFTNQEAKTKWGISATDVATGRAKDIIDGQGPRASEGRDSVTSLMDLKGLFG